MLTNLRVGRSQRFGSQRPALLSFRPLDLTDRMKGLRFLSAVCLLFCLCYDDVRAGNPERSGQAGATQLLINPYARSSGVNGLNVATAYGIESVINNPAGLALSHGTEVVFAHTRWLWGSGIGLNGFGVSQAIGNAGVIGASIVATDFGDIDVTTIDNPDGGLGTYSPAFINIGVSYARAMVPDRIFVGFTVKLITESTPQISSSGVAFDAGVQYRTRNGKFRLGVALRNIGPAMSTGGDALSARANLGGSNSNYTNQVETAAQAFEMPSVLYIGAAYEIRLGAEEYRYKTRKTKNAQTDVTIITKVDSMKIYQHKIVPMFTFVSNTFSQDQFGLGVEYAWREMVMVRAAYSFEPQMWDKEQSRNIYNGGLSAGATVEIPMFFKGSDGPRSAKWSSIGIDYSFRLSAPFSGTHCFGARIKL